MPATGINHEYLTNKFIMKNQIKSMSPFAAMVVACGALCFAASTFAASTSPAPDANASKKEMASKPKSTPAPKNSPATAQLSAKDKAFMKEAAKGGKMEVEMGQMAKAKGKSADVKKIGERMVTDHTKANNELMAIAKNKGVDLSKENPSMHKMNDASFDKEYIDMMVKDHEKDVAAFQNEAKNGSDPDVKAFASKTSEVIKKHLALVKAAQGKLK
jgi:putative membrane protein